MGNDEERNARRFLDQWSIYEGAKTRVKVDHELSEEIEVNARIHQASVLSPFHLTGLVDVVTELARENVSAGDLVMMSETIEELRNKFLK